MGGRSGSLAIQEAVDRLAKHRDRLGALNGRRLDRAVRAALADEEGGGPGDPELGTGGMVLADGGGILAPVETGVEGVAVEAQLKGKSIEVVDLEGAVVPVPGVR